MTRAMMSCDERGEFRVKIAPEAKQGGRHGPSKDQFTPPVRERSCSNRIAQDSYYS